MLGVVLLFPSPNLSLEGPTMRLFHHLTALALLTAGLGLGAQTPDWSFGAKYTIGNNINNTNKLHDSRALIGYSLVVERKLNATDSVYAEPTYRSFRWNQIETTQFGPGFTPGTGTPMTITPQNSFVGTSNLLESYGLTLGFRRNLTEAFSVNAGLAFNSMVSRQEVMGNINWTSSTTPSATTEHIIASPTKRGLNLGLTAGCRQLITETAFAEVSLNYMPYKMANWVPYAYTGQAAHMETLSKSKITAEFSFGIRF